jgi:predicted nucleotidyltransferase
MLNEDYKDMLQCLLEEKVRFLLVGDSPRRIDIVTRISGVDFEDAYANKEDVSIEGLQVPVISLEDLIANKRASGRTQDLADVEKLEALKQK